MKPLPGGKGDVRPKARRLSSSATPRCDAGTTKEAGATGGSSGPNGAVTERATAHGRSSRGVGGSSTDSLASYGYVTQSPIAAGAFLQVVRAKHMSSGREVAVKTFATRQRGGKAPADLDSIRAEVAALTVLQPSAHAHIANLVETFENDYELHAILEYCGGGSVQRHLQSQGHGVGLQEGEAAMLAAQVGSALAHMHGLGVTHRDVTVSYTHLTLPTICSV